MSEIIEQRPKEPKQNSILISEQGSFLFNNQLELRSSAQLAIQTKMAPEHLAAQGYHAVASALLFCKQYDLPQKAMEHMAFIKGKITAYGTLFIGIAQRHKDYGEQSIFFIDENCEKICVANKNLKTAIPWACVVQIKKKNSTVWNEYFFSVDDAEQAGLLTKNTRSSSGWIKYTKDLIRHKAIKRAYQSEYASAVEGIEYHEDVVEALEDKPSFYEKKKNVASKNKAKAKSLEDRLIDVTPPKGENETIN